MLVVLAAAVRLAVLAYESQLPLFSHFRLDSSVYDTMGRAIASGDLLLRERLGADPYPFNPLYAYLVGGIYAIGWDLPWSLRLIQLGLGVGTVLLVASLGRRLLGARWGFATGLAASFYGPLIYYETLVLSESLAAFLQTALLAALLGSPAAETVNARDESVASWRGMTRWALVGALLGACVALRGFAIFFVPVVAFALSLTTQKVKAAVVVALVSLSVVGPFLLRNRLATGRWGGLTSHGGIAFFVGNGPGAFGTFRIPPEIPGATNNLTQAGAMRVEAERAVGHRLTMGEADRYWLKRGLAGIVADPVAWVGVVVEKSWLYWNAREPANVEDYEFSRSLNPVLRLPLVQFGWISPFALLGTFVLVWQGGRRRLIGTFNLAGWAGVVVFFMLARYRLPGTPVLLLGSAVGAHWLMDRVHERRPKVLAGLVLAGTCLMLLVHWPKLPRPFDDEWFKLGYAYHLQKQLPKAADAYRKALAINGGNLSARKNLAFLLETEGRTAEARAEWQKLGTHAGRLGSAGAAYVETARQHLKGLP